jgi:hypothetical protein
LAVTTSSEAYSCLFVHTPYSYCIHRYGLIISKGCSASDFLAGDSFILINILRLFDTCPKLQIAFSVKGRGTQVLGSSPN